MNAFDFTLGYFLGAIIMAFSILALLIRREKVRHGAAKEAEGYNKLMKAIKKKNGRNKKSK